MASSTVGTAIIKLSFDGSDVKAELSKTSNQLKNAGTEAGSTFGNALTVAMGSLISKGISKIVSSISQNLDSAINRVDVINNFPKVMESLGFSTEEASASIKTISSRLDGLPSTLNGVVGDVQKLTATMGNLNTGMVNATSLGLALNDMFLAGGKGTEAASNAMEQYNQMLAQGKPDMQSWRSILNAAPGQLNQLAKTLLGATATQQDLYEALQEGNVTFDQMNEAIVRLDKEGGKGFASYEKQARSATGGVGTALENVQNRISKAIAKVIDAIGSENIANAINGISAGFEGIGVEVGKVIKGVIDGVGEVVRFLQHNTGIVDVIKGILATIVSLGISYKIVELQKKITNLFNVLAAHPILLVASAIAGLVTAIGSMISTEDDYAKAVKNTREEYQKAKDSLDELHKSRQETLDKGMSELSYYDSLAKELDIIVDENGKVKSGYEDRAKFIVNTLQSALGVEIDLQNGIIQQYQNIRSEIDKTIQKKQAELKLKAQEEAYTEAIKRRGEVSKRMAEIQAQIDEAFATRDWQKLLKVPQLWQSLADEEKLYREYSSDIKMYLDDYTAYTEGRLDDINVAYWKNSYEIAKAQDASIEEIQTAIRVIDNELELMAKNVDLIGEDTYNTEVEKLTKMKNELSSKLNGMTGAVSNSLGQAKNTTLSMIDQTVSSASSKMGQFSSVGQRGGNALASGFSSKSGAVSSSVNGVINNAKNAAWDGAWNNGWNLGNRISSAAANGISASSWQAVNQAYSLMDRLKSIVGQSIPGPTIEGFRQSYNFATHSYEYTPMAEGGYVGGATTALIGEAGKEVVLPLQQNTNNWSGLLANAIMEQMDTMEANRPITVYMNNTIDNDMSIDEVGRKFSQSIRRYA